MYPEFYGNETIQRLAYEPRWTISTTQDVHTVDRATGQPKVLGRKTPLDVRQIAKDGHIRGAFGTPDGTCLMTLEELREFFPGAVNNAFYVSAQIDEVLILDIEPTCPAEIRDELLALPSLYSETSMSGKGYHLVMPLPSNFEDFPIAIGKRKLQHRERWYEVLIDHWVTFTRNPVAATSSSSGLTWEEVWADLAAEAREVTTRDFDLSEERPEISTMDAVVASVVAGRPYGKTLADFSGDHSRWEFGLLGYYWNRLEAASRWSWVVQMHQWTDSDRVWALYEVAQRVLPARDKHASQRNGMPYLLYAASTLASQREVA